MSRQKDFFIGKNPAITVVLSGKEANCRYIMFYVQFLFLAWSCDSFARNRPFGRGMSSKIMVSVNQSLDN